MKTHFGLIGKHLSHSFSKEIHEHFTNSNYDLIELDEISQFMSDKKFTGVNVTIPYKKDVIPFLDELSEEARAIGVVNTILNSKGKLIGYNTDYFGLKSLCNYHNISVDNKKVLILGNGSTARTIEYYCNQNNTNKITVAARHPRANQIHLNALNTLDYDIIFNATPVGMYPNILAHLPIKFSNNTPVSVVVDVIYNPLKSTLLREAEQYNVKTVNGLYMLVMQAIKAIEIFHNKTISLDHINHYYKRLLKSRYNIVLIGMPMSGKSLYGKKLSNLINMKLVDIDQEIEKKESIPVPKIFEDKGENYFRNIESKVVLHYAKEHNYVISCGGGVITSVQNIDALRSNGIVIFIDTPLSMLKRFCSKNRPLLKDNKSLEILYNKRYNTYINAADIVIKKDTLDVDIILNKMVVALNEYTSIEWT